MAVVSRYIGGVPYGPGAVDLDAGTLRVKVERVG